MAASWHEVAAAERVEPGAMRTFKHGRHQLVVGRTGEGDWFALDNRCPHEGYPLATGFLKECRLTCAWHNWKFDVRDGSCVVGGEPVRSYSVRVQGGRVEVDLSDPDPGEHVPRLFGSLLEALFEHDLARSIRDSIRLLAAGVPLSRLLAEVAVDDARRGEYGSTHALPLAADACRLAADFDGVAAVRVVAPVLEMTGESNQRLRPRPAAPAVAAAGDVGDAIRRAVEDEDAALAEGRLRGAIEAGADRSTIETWLYAIIADHFTDFGHQLIYLVKAQELLDRAGGTYAPEIHAGILFGTVFGTREDTLPYFRPYVKRWSAVEEELLGRRARPGAPSQTNPSGELWRAALDGTVDQACDALIDALRGGARSIDVARDLVVAASHRLLRFDPAHDSSRDVAENWLWATHRLTFASAARNAVARFDDPRAIRFLFQALVFIHTGRPMDVPSSARPAPDHLDDPDDPDHPDRVDPAPGDAGVDAVLAAIRERRAADAVRNAAAVLARGDGASLTTALARAALEAPFVRPIVVAHAIKTTLAAIEEWTELEGHAERAAPILAAARFLASPIEERRVPGLVESSLRFVLDGVVPRKLTQ